MVLRKVQDLSSISLPTLCRRVRIPDEYTPFLAALIRTDRELLVCATASLWQVSRSYVRAFMDLSQGKVGSAGALGNSLGRYDPEKALLLHQMIAIFKGKTLDRSPSEWIGGKDGVLQPADLFRLFDRDHDGMIEFLEFHDILTFLNIKLSTDRAQRMFVSVDRRGSCELTYTEFQLALELLEEELAQGALAALGLSTERIVRVVLGMLGILCLIFIFIFSGIKALSVGTAFNACVNSVLPLGAGFGTMKGTKGGDGVVDEEVKDTLKKVSEEGKS